MTLGVDLAEVFEDVGTEVSIFNYATKETVTEFVDFRIHTDSEYLLRDEFMSECSFKYNTVAEEGNILTVNVSSRPYIILAMNDEIFENTIITKEGILYRCNVVVDIKRQIGEVRNEDYELVPEWDTMYTGIRCLFAGSTYDSSVTGKSYARFRSGTDKLFISKSIDIREDDRLLVTDILETRGSPITAESYHVLIKEDFRMPGVFVCDLESDTRE